MEVTNVQARPIDVPVELPLRDEPGTVTLVFTEIETSDSIQGYGLTGGSYWWSAITNLINQELGPAIIGKNPVESEAISALLWDSFNPRYQTGVFSSALSCLDISLWDLKGKKLGEPVWRLLGGDQNPVESYVTCGLSHYSDSELIEVATIFIEDGHTRLKMHAYDDESKVDITRSANRIRQLWNEIGPDVDLMIDANYKYSIDQASNLCRRIEDLNIRWFEEPLKGNDHTNLGKLRQQTTIPIAAGQNEGNKHRHRVLIENEAIDICQPNVVNVGGFTEGKKVAALAEAFNLNIANGGAFPHHNAHLQSAVPNGTWVEYHLGLWKAGEKIYVDPYEPDGDALHLPEEPGLGLNPDMENIDKFEVESPAPPSRSFRGRGQQQITR